MDKNYDNLPKREVRSFLMARDPSIDRRFRPRPQKKLRLFDEIHESEESGADISDTDSEYAAVDDESTKSSIATEVSGTETGPLIYLRLRPVVTTSTSYVISDVGNVLITCAATENNSNSLNKANMEKHFGFTTIFDQSVNQKEVFEKCIGSRIDEEESFTMMTYGTSGSGKTFTLLGDQQNAGIIPRALECIFKQYAGNIYPEPNLKLKNGRITILEDEAALLEMQTRRRILSLCADVDVQNKRLQESLIDEHNFQTKDLADTSVLIWISFVEIYNEMVYDLLALPRTNSQSTIVEPPRKNLNIVGNSGKVYIKGLTSIYVKSSLEALKLLRYGLQRVTYASTAVNTNSSRSHCVFFVDVLKFYRSGETTQTSYKFCDLAGSERLDKTGNIGSRLKEAQRINTSLMVLGRCLEAASTTRKKTNEVIPFRESKLTMLLQAPLLGKEKLAMIVTVTPLDKYYEENMNVLNFASIAKNIIFKEPPVKQQHSRYSGFVVCTQNAENYVRDREYIRRLEEENIYLRAEVERIKTEHFNAMQEQEEDLRNQLTNTFEEMLRVNKEQFEQRMQKKLYLQQREYEAQLASQKRKYEEKLEDLRDELDEYKEKSCSDIELIDDDKDK